MSFIPYRRGGMGSLGLTPGYTPEQQAMADAFKSQFGAPPATYVAPAPISTPSCAFGPTADTEECQVQVRAAQQQRMQAGNDSNYAVDLQNCLNTFPQPDNCYARTFGLTPTGGYTSDAFTQGPQTILDAGGHVVDSPPPVFSETPNPYIPAPPAPPVRPTGTTVAPLPHITNPVPTVGGGGYVDEAASFLSQDVSAAGFNFPLWGVAAAGIGLLFVMGGRH